MKFKERHIQHDHNSDGLDRRGFLECMAWAGTGMLWTVSGGLLGSTLLPSRAGAADIAKGSFSFVQISDSHIGFSQEGINTDVTGTLKAAIERINALPQRPDFILHTGDLTHLAGADEFDTLDQLLKGVKTQEIFFVPGEHDVTGDNGKLYLERFGKKTKGQGWHSFDHNGVHFIGLVNVVDIQQNGLGALGAEQLEWLEDDLKDRSAETPIVVFAHIPLWSVYPQWGWGTDDGAQALNDLKRFGSVTVLNGHIHQTMKKVEGHVVFHTARSTAFPQPEPGKAPKPGPLKVEAGKLREHLGITDVNYSRTTTASRWWIPRWVDCTPHERAILGADSRRQHAFSHRASADLGRVRLRRLAVARRSSAARPPHRWIRFGGRRHAGRGWSFDCRPHHDARTHARQRF